MLVAAPLYLAHKFSDEVSTSRLSVNQLVKPVSGRSLARRWSSIGRRGGLEIQDTELQIQLCLARLVTRREDEKDRRHRAMSSSWHLREIRFIELRLTTSSFNLQTPLYRYRMSLYRGLTATSRRSTRTPAGPPVTPTPE